MPPAFSAPELDHADPIPTSLVREEGLDHGKERPLDNLSLEASSPSPLPSKTSAARAPVEIRRLSNDTERSKENLGKRKEIPTPALWKARRRTKTACLSRPPREFHISSSLVTNPL